jgi:hypothetical protein
MENETKVTGSGIVERMKAATTAKERKELYAEAKGYKYISPATMRKLDRMVKPPKKRGKVK